MRFNFLSSFISAFLVCLHSVAADSSQLVNLMTAPGVSYRYVDASGNFLDGASLKDTSGRMLFAGPENENQAVSTTYRNLQEKGIRVLVEFPIPVTPASVNFIWRWAHNPKQWFDSAEVFMGNSRSDLRKVASYRNEGVGRGNSMLIEIPLLQQAEPARYILLELFQEASAERYMISMGQMSVMGSKEQFTLMERLLENEAKLSIGRQYPCNLFTPGQPAVFDLSLFSPITGRGSYTGIIRNYFGDIVEEVSGILDVERGIESAFEVVVDGLDVGYYEMSVTLSIDSSQRGNVQDIVPAVLHATAMTSFGIAPEVIRTAEEALAAGARFGIQENFSSEEIADGFVRLGLPWIRGLLAYGPQVGNLETPNWQRTDNFIGRWHQRRSGLMLFEVKTFPFNAYDARRYGDTPPRDWMTGTLPLKEPYQEFVVAQMQKVPQSQLRFEIWNEPWDRISPEDFAMLSQWTLEAIRSVHPDAEVGPNLRMGTYLLKVIDAGGMDGMDMMTIHPYSPDFVSSPEKMELRERIRSYQRLFREKLGRELPLYVTEIGWPTPLLGPMSENTEARQAQYMVRASLGMYAEGIKAVMPYAAGQPERKADDKESYFGFVRKNQEPKPVLLAYAAMARLIEGSDFVGDVWIAPNVGGMLFKKSDSDGRTERTLVVYADGESQNVLIRPFAKDVKIVDIMGRERTVDTRYNRLSLTATDDPLYVIGVGEELEQKAVLGDGRAVWTDIYERAQRVASRVNDGKAQVMHVDSPAWDAIDGVEIQNPNVDKAIASAVMKCSWDDTHLYFHFDIKDDSPGINLADGVDIWQGDSIELFIGTDPESSVPGFLRANDYQILVTPFADSASGNPKTVIAFASPEHRGKSSEAIDVDFAQAQAGWSAVIAIPFETIGMEGGVISGKLLTMEGAVNNRGSSHPRYQLTSNGRADNAENAGVWSYLLLK